MRECNINVVESPAFLGVAMAKSLGVGVA